MLQFYDRAADAVRAIYDRRIATPPVLDTARYFPNAARFTEHWPGIRQEALAIANTLPQVPHFQDLLPAQTDIAAQDGRDWRMFEMKGYGVGVEHNLVRCPFTAGLLAQTPESVSAVLSFLRPASISRGTAGRSAASCAST